MPCRSDYLEPTIREKESLKVISFLKELGDDVTEYDKSYGRLGQLHKDTARLCQLCQSIDVSNYSLELQIWWRDHKERDAKRLKKELDEIEIDKNREIALNKLSNYEKEILGLN